MYVIDDEEIKREVDRFYDAARESLSAVWRAVDHVAQALLKHAEPDHDGLDEALGDTDICRPVFAVQQAHGLRRAGVTAADISALTWRP